MSTEITLKTKANQPLVRDLLVSAAFLLVAILFASSTRDPVVNNLIGASIGFGFGFAIRSIMAYRKHVTVHGGGDVVEAS